MKIFSDLRGLDPEGLFLLKMDVASIEQNRISFKSRTFCEYGVQCTRRDKKTTQENKQNSLQLQETQKT